MDQLEDYDSDPELTAAGVGGPPYPKEPRPRISSKFLLSLSTTCAMKNLEELMLCWTERDVHVKLIHQHTKEEEARRSAQARDVPMGSGDLPSGEIPEIPKEQEVKNEAVVYQEELDTRKKIDIFTQPSSSEFLKLLAPEAEPSTSESQHKLEEGFFEKQKTSYNRPFQNKMPDKLDEALEKEPRVKLSVPKPEPKGDDKADQQFSSALEGLSTLDRNYKSKFFGFYGRGFRDTHNKALNFGRFRKGSTVHPCAKFDFDERKICGDVLQFVFREANTRGIFLSEAYHISM